MEQVSLGFQLLQSHTGAPTIFVLKQYPGVTHLAQLEEHEAIDRGWGHEFEPYVGCRG